MATFKKFNKDKRPKRNTQSLLFKRKRFCRFTVDVWITELEREHAQRMHGTKRRPAFV